MDESIKRRYTILTILFCSVMFVVLIQLVNLQIIKGKEYDEQSQKILLRERQIIPARGNIFDKNSIPIAVNRETFSVDILKTDISIRELNSNILKLIDIFEKNNEYYVDSLCKYITFNPIGFGQALDSDKKVKEWKKDIGISAKNLSKYKTAQDIFEYLRKEKFKIDNSYSDEQAYKIMRVRYELLIRVYSSLNPICLAQDVSRETVAIIEEKNFEFPGIFVSTDPRRKYVEGDLFAHVLGYVSRINSTEYERLKEEGYRFDDIIGKSGVELSAEKELKGTYGLKRVIFDMKGRRTEETIAKSAVPGNDIVLTIDSKLQKVALESLKKNIEIIKRGRNNKTNFGDAFAGSVVAMDVNSGEILAMVSYPNYDPSIYLAPSNNKEAQQLKYNLITDSENSPMLNRAVQGLYIPGSIYKPITAIAGLEEGIITPETTIKDTGKVNIGGWMFYCLEYRKGGRAHGDINLEKALAHSCNIYFHELGYRTTIDKIDKWAKNFGLGEVTGIDIPGEKKGIRANKETKKKLRNDIWRPADTAQTAIGQFDNLFTPIQLVNYISAVANGGKRFEPHVIKKVVRYDGMVISEAKPKYSNISVKQGTLSAVRKGMVAVTNSMDGTAVRIFKDFPFNIAGKTGTPETGNEAKHSSNGLFICYAPADKPKIAICVVVERGVWGANTAPIAKDVLAEYFSFNNRDESKESNLESDDTTFIR